MPDALSVSVTPCSETFSLLKDTRFRVWSLNFYLMPDKDKHHISFFIRPAPRCEWWCNTGICSPGFRWHWCLMTETSASSTDTQVSMLRLSQNISKVSPFHFYTFIRSVFSLPITGWIRRHSSENSLVFVDEAFGVGIKHFDARGRSVPAANTMSGNFLTVKRWSSIRAFTPLQDTQEAQTMEAMKLKAHCYFIMNQ